MMDISQHKAVWRLAGPLILTNISIALLGIVDTAVVGHLQAAYYLGAVAVGAVIFDFIYWGMGFLRMGTTALVAQSEGSEDADEMRTVLCHSLIVSLVIAFTILFFQDLIVETGIRLVGGSEQVQYYTRSYFYWAIWGAPAVLVTMSLVGCLLGMQDAKATLITAVLINLVNIVLDLLFVYGFHLDVRGVALASVCAQYTGVVVAAYLVRRNLSRYSGSWRREMIFSGQRLRRLLVLNQNIFIRTICLIFVFAFFTRQGARQGEVILAANAVLLNFQLITALGLDGFANAAEVLVGKAIGARSREQFKRAVLLSAQWACLISLALTILYFMFGQLLIAMMTDLREVISFAEDYLIWVVVLPVISVWCFVLDGVFIGATRSAEMRNTMLFSTFMVFLPAWYLSQVWHNHGLWFAFLLFFIARGLSMGFVAYRIERVAPGFIEAGSIKHHAG